MILSHARDRTLAPDSSGLHVVPILLRPRLTPAPRHLMAGRFEVGFPRTRAGFARRLAVTCAALGLLACGGDTGVDPGDGTGSVTGVVQDVANAQPLAGSIVVVAGLAANAGADGRFQLDNVPVGRQPLSVAHDGYIGMADSVSVENGQVTDITLALTAGGGPPPAPAGVTVGPGSTLESNMVSWQDVAGATSYTVYWATTPGVLPESATKVPGVSSPFQHTNLTHGTTYYYVVTAIGPGGESALSEEVSAAATQEFGIAVLSPKADALVDSSFLVTARVVSLSQLTSVVASVGGNSAPMSRDPNTGVWSGTITLTGLPSPSDQQLTVTATDAQGHSGQVVVPIRFDRPPAVTFTLPTTGTVARPTTRVVASCQDDGPAGCVGLSLVANAYSGNPVVLATGSDHIDQTVSLAAFDGTSIDLQVQAQDGAGQVTRVRHDVYVETSPHLTPVADADSGTGLDADQTRILLMDTTASVDNLRLFDRGTGASTLVFSQSRPLRIEQAALTPRGVLIRTRDIMHGATSATLHELRDGTLTTLLDNRPFALFLVEGKYALWTILDFGSGVGDEDFRRDLDAGTTVSLGIGSTDHDVTPDGDVILGFGENVAVWHNGTLTFLTNDGSLDVLNGGVVGDGVHVVWRKAPHGVFQPSSIRLADPAGDIVLASDIRPDDMSGPPRNYQVNGGWIAFTRPDPNGILQVWVRSPSGVETQVGSLGQSSGIEAVSPSGQVVFDAAPTGTYRRYLGSAGSSATDIGGVLGSPIFINGQLHVLIGASLFRVN